MYACNQTMTTIYNHGETAKQINIRLNSNNLISIVSSICQINILQKTQIFNTWMYNASNIVAFNFMYEHVYHFNKINIFFVFYCFITSLMIGGLFKFII